MLIIQLMFPYIQKLKRKVKIYNISKFPDSK
jgi:hypothetical protein